MDKWIDVTYDELQVGNVLRWNDKPDHKTVKVTEILNKGSIRAFNAIHPDKGVIMCFDSLFRDPSCRIQKLVTYDPSKVSATFTPMYCPDDIKLKPGEFLSEALTRKPIPAEPGRCLHCGAKAYVGLVTVECSAKCKDSQ
jgi:hypothetical protein